VEGGSSKVVQNVDILLQHYMESQPRRPGLLVINSCDVIGFYTPSPY
jgi:hypothetical protein